MLNVGVSVSVNSPDLLYMYVTDDTSSFKMAHSVVFACLKCSLLVYCSPSKLLCFWQDRYRSFSVQCSETRLLPCST